MAEIYFEGAAPANQRYQYSIRNKRDAEEAANEVCAAEPRGKCQEFLQYLEDSGFPLPPIYVQYSPPQTEPTEKDVKSEPTGAVAKLETAEPTSVKPTNTQTAGLRINGVDLPVFSYSTKLAWGGGHLVVRGVFDEGYKDYEMAGQDEASVKVAVEGQGENKIIKVSFVSKQLAFNYTFEVKTGKITEIKDFGRTVLEPRSWLSRKLGRAQDYYADPYAKALYLIFKAAEEMMHAVSREDSYSEQSGRKWENARQVASFLSQAQQDYIQLLKADRLNIPQGSQPLPLALAYPWKGMAMPIISGNSITLQGAGEDFGVSFPFPHINVSGRTLKFTVAEPSIEDFCRPREENAGCGEFYIHDIKLELYSYQSRRKGSPDRLFRYDRDVTDVRYREVWFDRFRDRHPHEFSVPLTSEDLPNLSKIQIVVWGAGRLRNLTISNLRIE